ncbi:MAG: ribosome maturation factor RimM [Terriglobia bacterium]
MNKAEFLAIARIVRPWGRHGEVAVEVMTDFPERFTEPVGVYLESANHHPEPVRMENAWEHKGRMVLKLAGVDSIEAAGRLRGRHLLIASADRAVLPENSYYWPDLVGCRVVRGSPESSSEIGIVTEVEPTGGVALLHVARPNEAEALVPLAQAICKQIDIQAKKIVIDPPGGLLALNNAEVG